jgi:hypothetical protein
MRRRSAFVTEEFSFARIEIALVRAASLGVRDAADLLAQSLRESGVPALSRAAATGAVVTAGSTVAPGTIEALRPQVAAGIARALVLVAGGRP